MPENQEKYKKALTEIQKIKKDFMNQMSKIQLEYDKKIQGILDEHEINTISKTIK